jgi:uncharacterized GH25 family protein
MSNLDPKISDIELITLYQNSPDLKHIDSRIARIIPQKVVGAQLAFGQEQSDGDGKTYFDIPQPEDIVLADSKIVYHDKKKTTATLVIKVYNSSGKTLKGVDAAKSSIL